jgi:hypothetical protein
VKAILTAKPGAGVAIASGAVLGLVIGCALAWLVFSTHLAHRYPNAAFAPIAALLTIYTVIAVPSLRRTSLPLPIVVAAALFVALLTVLVGAILFEMILCNYDRYACINL